MVTWRWKSVKQGDRDEGWNKGKQGWMAGCWRCDRNRMDLGWGRYSGKQVEQNRLGQRSTGDPVSNTIPEPLVTTVRGWLLLHSEGISEFFQLQPRTPMAFFGLQLPPSSRNASEFFLLQAPSSNPQHYHTLLPSQHLTQYFLQRLLQDLHLLQR